MHRIHLTEGDHETLITALKEYLEMELETFRDDPSPEDGRWVADLKEAYANFQRFESV